MKKIAGLVLIIAISAFFAVSSSAVASDVKMIFKGSYQIVGAGSDNVHDFLDDTDDQTNYMEQRFRLTSIAATENVKGVLGIEIGWDEWGKSYSRQGGLGDYGTGTSASGGDTGLVADSNSTNLEARLLYVDFKIPGTSFNISAGKQLLYTHDQLILTAAAPSPGIQFNYTFEDKSTFKGFWTKFIEGFLATDPAYSSLQGQGDSDSDLFYIEYRKAWNALNFGAYGAYGRDYREKWTSLSGGSIPEITYDGFGSDKGYDIDHYWVGGFGDFKLGQVKLNLHGAVSSGNYNAARGLTQDLDSFGYYGRLRASMNVKDLKFDIDTLYSSGDDDFTDNEINSFGAIEAPTTYRGTGIVYGGPNILMWGNGIASEEYTLACCMPFPLGLWFTKLGVTYPLGKATLFADYWYLNSAEDPAAAKTYGQTYRDRQIGHEFDLELHYKLTPKLTLKGELDYLVAGDYFKTSATAGPDNAWLVACGIDYNF